MKLAILLASVCFLVEIPAFPAEAGLDHIFPTVEQLKTNWPSRRMLVMEDQLSSPPFRTNFTGDVRWSQIGTNSYVGYHGCEAFAVMQYGESTNYLTVELSRYKSKDDLPPDWPKEHAMELPPPAVTNLGDAVRLFPRLSSGDSIAFSRGRYLAFLHPISQHPERVKALAEALDSNLVKAQAGAATNDLRSGRAK